MKRIVIAGSTGFIGRALVAALVARGMHVTSIMRPYFVLGPGRRWPYIVMPLHWIGRFIPGLAPLARTMVFNTREQVVHAIVRAIEQQHDSIDVWDATRIKGSM
ncbi:hypothetical protein BH10BAC6_BH10BAC6_09850 [soil metagenome]